MGTCVRSNFVSAESHELSKLLKMSQLLCQQAGAFIWSYSGLVDFYPSFDQCSADGAIAAAHAVNTAMGCFCFGTIGLLFSKPIFCIGFAMLLRHLIISDGMLTMTSFGLEWLPWLTWFGPPFSALLCPMYLRLLPVVCVSTEHNVLSTRHSTSDVRLLGQSSLNV